MRCRVIKRAFDIIFSSIGLLLCLPIFLLISFCVFRALGLPIFFRQIRPGKDGKLFQMVKFRTMKEALDADGVLLPDTQRLTAFGSFLRSSSLDELPEL